MPHRLLGHPVQAVFILAGFFTSFFASVTASMGTAAHGTTQTLFAAVDNTAVVSWAGTAVTVSAMCLPPLYRAVLKAYQQARDVKLAKDTAELDVYTTKIFDAKAAQGTAEGQLKIALEQLESVKLQLKDLQVENRQLAGEVSKTRHKTANLEQELALHKAVAVKTKAAAVKAGQVAQDSSNQVEALGQRVEAVEHVVASSSGVDFPSQPAVEPQNEGGAK